MKYFDEFDEYIEKLLLVQFDASEIIKHNLTKGEVREDFLKEEVSKQFAHICYHKGFIVDNEKEYQSGQLDIIITGHDARARKYGEQSMVDIKDTKIVLEVKSCANTQDLRKLERVAKELKLLSDEPSLKVGMYCYLYSIKEENMLKKFGFKYDKDIKGYFEDKSLKYEFENIDFILALDNREDETDKSRAFFIIKDVFSNRYVLNKTEPVSKNFFMLFSNI